MELVVTREALKTLEEERDKKMGTIRVREVSANMSGKTYNCVCPCMSLFVSVCVCVRGNKQATKKGIRKKSKLKQEEYVPHACHVTVLSYVLLRNCYLVLINGKMVTVIQDAFYPHIMWSSIGCLYGLYVEIVYKLVASCLRPCSSGVGEMVNTNRIQNIIRSHCILFAHLYFRENVIT